MSNASIKSRIRADLAALLADPSPKQCESFSARLEAHIGAMERLSMNSRKRGRALALDVLHKGWHLEEEGDGCVEELATEASAIKVWLEELPE